MVSSNACSMMERRPRAPVLRLSALRAMAVRAVDAHPARRLPSRTASELLEQRVLRFGQDLDESSLVQLIERGDHRQAADQLGDQAELDQVFGPRLRRRVRPRRAGLGPDRGREADAGFSVRSRMTFSRPSKAPPTMNRMLVVSTWTKSWRVLAPALRRHRGHRASISFSRGLLHALARYVTRDGRVVGLARDLVDFIDVDDGALRLLDLVVAVPAAASG